MKSTKPAKARKLRKPRIITIKVQFPTWLVKGMEPYAEVFGMNTLILASVLELVEYQGNDEELRTARIFDQISFWLMRNKHNGGWPGGRGPNSGVIVSADAKGGA